MVVAERRKGSVHVREGSSEGRLDSWVAGPVLGHTWNTWHSVRGWMPGWSEKRYPPNGCVSNSYQDINMDGNISTVYLSVIILNVTYVFVFLDRLVSNSYTTIDFKIRTIWLLI